MIDVCPPPTSGINTTTQTPLEITGEVCQCPYSDAVPITGQPNLVMVLPIISVITHQLNSQILTPPQGSAGAQEKLGLSPILIR